jgi:hypothetical protein
MTQWNPTPRQDSIRSISVAGVVFRLGDRVRLWPLGDADIFDIALKGKTAVIEAIEQDYEDRFHIVVTVDGDPGQDLGALGKPGHRFFFQLDEVEPLGDDASRS